MNDPYIIVIENPDGGMHFVSTWECAEDDRDEYIDYIYDTDDSKEAYKFETNPMRGIVFEASTAQFNKASVYVLGGPEPDVNSLASI